MAGRTIDKGRTNPLGLTDQQVRFCREYARSLHVGIAYADAGYTAKSRNARDAGGSTLLRNPKIQAYLKEVMDLDEVSVINAVTAIALTPITEVIQWDGKELIVKQTEQWSDRAKLAVKKVKAKTRTTITESGGTIVDCDLEVEMHDRLSALDKLMRKMKLYPKDVEPVTESSGSDSHQTIKARQQEARNIVLSEVLGLDAESDDGVAFAVSEKVDTRSQSSQNLV